MNDTLKQIHLESHGVKGTIYPRIDLDGEIVWSSYAQTAELSGSWVVNGGQTHPSREAARDGLCEGLNELITRLLWLSRELKRLEFSDAAR